MKIVIHVAHKIPCSKAFHSCHAADWGYAILQVQSYLLLHLLCVSPRNGSSPLQALSSIGEEGFKHQRLLKKCLTHFCYKWVHNLYLLNRSYCSSKVMTLGGNRPRKPSRSLSVDGKAVPWWAQTMGTLEINIQGRLSQMDLSSNSNMAFRWELIALHTSLSMFGTCQEVLKWA